LAGGKAVLQGVFDFLGVFWVENRGGLVVNGVISVVF
jgi:hypothetical protein